MGFVGVVSEMAEEKEIKAGAIEGVENSAVKLDGERDGKVEMEQSLTLHDISAPASAYNTIRAFFEQIGGAANAAVVLVKR